MDGIRPCPTPVCTPYTAPDGTVSMTCTSIAPEGCCLVAIPDTSTWQTVCATSPGGPLGPATVPAVSPVGFGVLVALIVVVGVRVVRR